MKKEEKRIMTITVTGAGGTVGSFVVDLLLSKGYNVIAVDRPGAVECLRKRREAGQEGLLVMEIDLRNEKTISNCFYDSDARQIPNADAVVHLAADLDIRKDYKALKKINVDAAINLFKELAKRRGKMFIHFSSGSIYADDGPYELDEKSPTKAKSGYELSKIRSEECLQLLASYQNAPKLIILRPALIYGPYGRFLASGVMVMAPLLSFLFGENLAPKLCGGPKTNLVHAEDVARAAVFLLENEKKIKNGEVFNIADDTPMGFGEVFVAAVAAYGIKTRFDFPLPPAALLALFKRVIDTELFFKIFDAPVDFLWWIIRKKYGVGSNFSARFEREMAAYFTKDTVFANDKIKQLGFKFKYPSVREGMKNVVEWYCDNNWIPKKVKPFWKF